MTAWSLLPTTLKVCVSNTTDFDTIINLMHKHLTVLQQEVKAWRDWFDGDGKIRTGKAKLTDIRTTTDKSGALNERAQP
jgi:hypothetical protein